MYYTVFYRIFKIRVFCIFGPWVCTSMGNATSAYMVCGRSIIDCDFILRLNLRVYHSLQGHHWWFTTSSLMVLLTSTKNRCFQKMKSQSPWSANAYREAHIWLVHQVPQAWWNYLRRYTTRIQGCEPCNNAGEQLCQLTVELCSSSKLSAFARRTTLLWRSPQQMRLQAPIPQLTDAILHRQLVYQTAEAEASRHHHGCLCPRDPI